MEPHALFNIVRLALLTFVNCASKEYTQEQDTTLGNDGIKTDIMRERRGNVLNTGKVRNQVVYNIDRPKFSDHIFLINSAKKNMAEFNIATPTVSNTKITTPIVPSTNIDISTDSRTNTTTPIISTTSEEEFA